MKRATLAVALGSALFLVNLSMDASAAGRGARHFSGGHFHGGAPVRGRAFIGGAIIAAPFVYAAPYYYYPPPPPVYYYPPPPPYYYPPPSSYYYPPSAYVPAPRGPSY